MHQTIQPGYMVFLADGQQAAGAVRDVKGNGHLVVNIENGGDFVVATDVVSDVHEDKVILDYHRLPAPMQEALHHLHEAESPAYRAADPDQGTPDA